MGFCLNAVEKMDGTISLMGVLSEDPLRNVLKTAQGQAHSKCTLKWVLLVAMVSVFSKTATKIIDSIPQLLLGLDRHFPPQKTAKRETIII